MSVRRGHVFIDLGGVWIYGRGEHVARLGDRLLFGRTGKQAVVADAVEALGQHVHQEAADELASSSVMVLYRPGPSIR